jgi:hypothetical protein
MASSFASSLLTRLDTSEEEGKSRFLKGTVAPARRQLLKEF